MDKKFIVNLQGKDFITYDGLLNEAHSKGLISIETELIKSEKDQCIMKATAKTDKGIFQGYGDADPSNVNKMIAKHLIRMAETRAKARALRDLTNIGMTALEELGGDEEPKQTPKQQQDKPKANTLNCSDCGAIITKAVDNYCKANVDKFKGKSVCQKCQKKYK